LVENRCVRATDNLHIRGVHETQHGRLGLIQQHLNKANYGIRAIGERGNALVEMTVKALRNVGLDPWRIGKTIAAALALPHINHARTT